MPTSFKPVWDLRDSGCLASQLPRKEFGYRGLGFRVQVRLSSIQACETPETKMGFRLAALGFRALGAAGFNDHNQHQHHKAKACISLCVVAPALAKKFQEETKCCQTPYPRNLTVLLQNTHVGA